LEPFLFPPQARDGSHRQSRCTKKDVGREELPAEIGPSDSQSKGEVRDGSWLCENAKTLDGDRRSYSSKTVLAINLASALN